MVDLRTATASEIVRAIRAREVSAREALDAQVERCDRWNPSLRAVVATDLERAWAAAAQADDRLARGEPAGPLHGLAMTIKDSFETEGLATTSGAPELREHVPQRDADPVARLRAAGAIVFGKTNLPMYAGDWQSYNALHGTTSNPWDLGRTPGGSSGGSAAAVAAGISPLELGSDIGGSIRVPSHFCGTFGHKPTQGLVPDRGHIPGPPGMLAPPDLGVSGPLGRSTEDLRLALEVLVAPGPHDPPLVLADPPDHVVARPRVVVHLDDPLCPPGSEVRALAEAAARALEAAGAVLVEAPVPPLADTHRLYQRLLTAVMAAGFPEPFLRDMAAAAADPEHPLHDQAGDYVLTHRDWLRANEARHRLRDRWAREVFAIADVVLAPIAPIPAFEHDTETPFRQRTLVVDGEVRDYDATMLPWPGLATLPGLPATAVPVGRTATGLPVGVQLVGARWADRTCLAVAALLEAATGGFVPPPEPG